MIHPNNKSKIILPYFFLNRMQGKTEYSDNPLTFLERPAYFQHISSKQGINSHETYLPYIFGRPQLDQITYATIFFSFLSDVQYRSVTQTLKGEVVYRMEYKFYPDDYANIIIFQKGKGSMSYYTLLPNYYQGFNTTRVMSCPQPQQNILPVLRVLSQALKFSISQFSTFYKPNVPEIEANSQTFEGKGQFQRQQIIENLKSEEKKQKTSHFKKHQIGNFEQNAANLQVCGQKHNQNSSQTHSNDYVLSENIVATLLKENDEFSPHHRKENIRPKKQSFHILVPQVDLLETVTPPTLLLGQESLRKIREGLMLRKVQVWNEKMKNRKDKREIRMLNK